MSFFLQKETFIATITEKRNGEKMKKTVCAFVLAACIGMGACSTTESVEDLPPEVLYRKGYDAFQEKDYEKAAGYFDEVEKQHPYSVWSERSQIMAAYAFYQKNEYDDAVLALDRFIQLHPGNRNTPYAFYLKGLCYYEQMSDPAREQSVTEKAKQTFEELIARYPESVYAGDARAKMGSMENRLAAQEMGVGRYYLKHQDLIPAINRFKTVVEDYPATNQVPEAYYRLSVGYVMLGMTGTARQMAGVLTEKYPRNEWTARAERMLKKQGL